MIVGLLGTDFSSNNRGCGALGYASVEILNSVCKEKGVNLEVYAFLYRLDPKPQINDPNVVMHYIIIKPKKIAFWKQAVQVFNKCDFVWDFTGGDSFSDIYGIKRFILNSAVKELAILCKTKFFMAPQTIGPFEKKLALLWAKHILKKSDICFVRDSISEEYVKNTFGVVPMVTTDVAFALPYPEAELRTKDKICVGLNPSGLLWDGTKEFCVSKHIKVDYKEYIKGVLSFLCNQGDYEVFLIPHSFSKKLEYPENDYRACLELNKMFPSTKLLCDFETPMEAKQAISSMDVFIGARMHATIAAFSTGVVTIPFSYSRKFEGLYQDLLYPFVISATRMETQEAVDKTLKWIADRDLLSEKMRDASIIVKEKQQVLSEVLDRAVLAEANQKR